MKVGAQHGGHISAAGAMEVQRRLASQVSRRNEVASPRRIAGVDISVDRVRGVATGAVVVLSYPQLEVVAVQLSHGRLAIPYIPGLLSFREAPVMLDACRGLAIIPDVIIVDGQGICHPRRLGLASHLGLLLDMPTIGCAKSRLCGSHDMPGEAPGSYAEVVDGSEVIGAALRTRYGVKPVYVSIGHKVDLEAAISWVLACCRGYRLPEPTRLAHLAAGGNLKSSGINGLR